AMTAPSEDPAPPRRGESITKRLRLPRLSGKVSSFWLVCCFGLTAVLIPAVLRLPRWIEFEIVLAVWWVGWLAVLSCLLYQGQRVTDDHQLGPPRNWLSGVSRPAAEDASGCLDLLFAGGLAT